jgi:hypothetical protein
LVFIVCPLFLCSHYESISGRLEGFSGLLPAICAKNGQRTAGKKTSPETSEKGLYRLVFQRFGLSFG